MAVYILEVFSIDELPERISPPVVPVVEKFKARFRAGNL